MHQGYNDIAGSCGNEQAQNYKFLDKEYESSFGLNVTETDFRQYDSALGRFYSIDALAERSFDVTPYHYALNNPVYWADPTGLISDPFWNSIWSFSPSGVTNWQNVGGSFLSDRVNPNGTVWEVFYDGSVTETLSMMYMEAKAGAGGGVDYSSLGSFNIGKRVQDHVYRNSSLYQYHRDQMMERQMDDFQEGMEFFGMLDPTGGIDLLNGVGYGIRGQYGNAAISGIAMFPYLGDLAKLGKASKAINSSAHLATEGANLSKHLSQLEKYGQTGFKELQNGRFRYYGDITSASAPGEMIGRRVVREWNPATGGTRAWMETLDNAGSIRIVRPETGGAKVHFMFDKYGNFIKKW